MDRDTILLAVAVGVAILCLVKLADRRRRQLESLLKTYIDRQAAWQRRRQKAATLLAQQKENQPVDSANNSTH